MTDRLSVLIVDDSRSVISQLEGIIAEFDWVDIVGTAREGASAIRMVAETRPDLVLMDIVMPVMDGMTALRAIAAANPDVQVAMLSSVGGRASMAEQAFRLGAVQVLGKPVDKDTLAALFTNLKSAGS